MNPTSNSKQHRMYIIGIAGGTASGKSTVVKEIVNSLPEGSVAVIPQDSYYKDSSHVPVEERQFINFDHPDAFDWNLLVEQITLLALHHSYYDVAIRLGSCVFR